MKLSIPRFLLAIVFVSIAAFRISVVAAGEAELVDGLEKLATQLERLDQATQKFADALAQVKDSDSANKAASQLKAAASDYAAEADASVLAGAAVDKMIAGGNTGRSPEHEARRKAAGKQIGDAIKEYGNQTSRLGKEFKRVGEMTGLPEAFWNEFRVAQARFAVSTYKALQGMGEEIDAPKMKIISDLLAFYEKHGPSKVVQVVLSGGTKAQRAAAEKSLQNAVGPTVSVIAASDGQLRSLTIAPVENFDEFVKTIKVGKAVERDKERKTVNVQL